MEVIRTDAENGLIELGQSSFVDGPQWLKDLQDTARAEFKTLGLPHRRVEEWKYTDLKSVIREVFPTVATSDISTDEVNALIGDELSGLDAYRFVFVDGQLSSALSDLELGEGVEVYSLSDALKSDPEWLQAMGSLQKAPRDAVQALNLTLMQGGVAVRISERVMLDKPVHLIFVTTPKGSSSFASRLFFDIGSAVELEILESHVSMGDEPCQTNVVSEFIVGNWAKVHHVKYTEDHKESVHLSNVICQLGQETNYSYFQFTLNGGVSRNQFEIRYDGADAKADISGAALLAGKSHADMTLVMDHAATGCQSRELFKTVLDGNARAVFQGKVIVQPGAQKTDGEMMSKALLLSDDAEFDSKPELEIYADDVLCGHGATTGQIDEDLLFYLLARGIPEREAQSLLIQAFFGEAMELIENDTVRDALIARAVAWHGSH